MPVAEPFTTDPSMVEGRWPAGGSDAPAAALAAYRAAATTAPIPGPVGPVEGFEGLEGGVLEFVAELRSPAACVAADGLESPVRPTVPADVVPAVPAVPAVVVPVVETVVAPVVEPLPEVAVVITEVAAEPTAEPTTVRARGVSVDGRPVSTDFAAPPAGGLAWPAVTSMEVFLPDETFDFTDLNVLNRQLMMAMRRVFEVSQGLKGEQRALAEAELVYRQHLRRSMVKVSGGSAETRKALAELACEGYENEVWLRTQTVEEMKKRSMDCRDHLKGLENLSHNVRAQIQVGP
ncbi:hypothetical protein [Tessaracoccus sp.]